MGMALVLGLGIFSGPAAACHNGVERRVVPLTRLVARAARAISRERPTEAVSLAGRAIRRIRSQRRSRRSRLLMNRSKRILALATVRLDGAVDSERFIVRASMDATAREASLRWAVGILEYAFSEDGGPVATARYAEALAHFPAQRVRARSLLRRLHASDTMPGAGGYRVLAEVCDDETDRAEALALCRERAGARAPSLCVVRSPGG